MASASGSRRSASQRVTVLEVVLAERQPGLAVPIGGGVEQPKSVGEPAGLRGDPGLGVGHDGGLRRPEVRGVLLASPTGPGRA